MTTKKSAHLATKAQALAVRDYLQSLGIELSHVQALEVIARGQGMRSRQVLASANRDMKVRSSAAEEGSGSSQLPSARGHWTRVSYGYIDGSNCKRFSSTVFRGRLTVDQLRFIASKLDEGLYFVPAQIGFECLQLAFNQSGDDHYWHKLELGDAAGWELDAEGFVLRAGDVEQIFSVEARDFATDADTSNLFWRFARLTTWDYGLQEQAVNQHVWRAPEPFLNGVDDEDVNQVIKGWQQHPRLASLPHDMLAHVAEWLLDADMLPFPTTTQELRRPVGPNAYQFCILQAPEPGGEDVLVLNLDVSTLAGEYLTQSPVVRLTVANYGQEMLEARRMLTDQRQAVRSLPAVYDEAFA